jgi:hypothetical protein
LVINKLYHSLTTITRFGELLGGKSSLEPASPTPPAPVASPTPEAVMIADEPKMMDLEESDGADVLTEDKPEEKKSNTSYNFIRD